VSYRCVRIAGKNEIQPYTIRLLKSKAVKGVSVMTLLKLLDKLPLISLFWFLAPCRILGRWKRFGETYCFHVQGWRWRRFLETSAPAYDSTRRQKPERRYTYCVENVRSHKCTTTVTWGSHGGDCEDGCLLGCSALQSCWVHTNVTEECPCLRLASEASVNTYKICTHSPGLKLVFEYWMY
jgi:hypothetical protein